MSSALESMGQVRVENQEVREIVVPSRNLTRGRNPRNGTRVIARGADAWRYPTGAEAEIEESRDMSRDEEPGQNRTREQNTGES